MKKIYCLLSALVLFFACSVNTLAYSTGTGYIPTVQDTDFKVEASSAVLMEAESGKMLFAQNEDAKASPASVTKVMTLLLVMEAIENGKISENDTVSVSGHAASMGGSQVFLEEGETMSVKELLKCTVIASANDAAVALAEHVGGSEKLFVSLMNKRAKELGMENTNFENVTGLDDTTLEHYTSAEDIAIMSRELIKHNLILEFSSLWQDTIRNGEFTLTNTNRLVRYYDGCNGLKTGSTDKAGYCISATAKRGDLQLIAVIMGAETRDNRNSAARSLLDFGFSNYTLYKTENRALECVPVKRGVKDKVTLYTSGFSAVIPKGEMKNIELVFDIPESITAPFKNMDKVGVVTYKLGDNIIGFSDIYVGEDVEKASVLQVFCEILKNIFLG